MGGSVTWGASQAEGFHVKLKQMDEPNDIGSLTVAELVAQMKLVPEPQPRRRRTDGLCPRCGTNPRRSEQPYCPTCTIADRNERRPSEAARARAACVERGAEVVERRDLGWPAACVACDAGDPEPHALDDDPDQVVWVCGRCHTRMHRPKRGRSLRMLVEKG